MDCGFQVYKVAGTVYDLYDNKWKPDDGHVIIILHHNNKDYVIDAGFASHLPYIQSLLTEKSSLLKRVNIEFAKRITRKGTHILEMRKGANGNLQISCNLNLQMNGK